MAEIRIQGVTKVYDNKVRAVDDVDLTVREGELLVLLGPSGCGKTTLLRTIAGLEYPQRGRILIGEREVTALPPRRRNIAMVFQSYAVFPHLTVFENIAFGLRMHDVPKAQVRERVERAAALVQLSEQLDRYPAKLSGGQRQRVAVARAVVMEANVLLMDEPLSNLDALLRLQFRADLKKLVADLATTTLYVTHDQVEALSLGDRVAVMRAGRIVQCDTPTAVYDRPATRFVGGFIGNPPMNFLEGELLREGAGAAVAVGQHRLEAPAGLRAHNGGRVHVGIRGESIEALEAPADGALPARTEVVESLGSHLLLTADVDGQTLKVLTRTDFPARPGEQLWLRPEPDKLRWFDVETGQRLVDTAEDERTAEAGAGAQER